MARANLLVATLSLVGVLRELWAGRIAHQISAAVKSATAPLQCEIVLSTLSPRRAMLETLATVEGGPATVPFVRMYGEHSIFLSEGQKGMIHRIEQGEGGETG